MWLVFYYYGSITAVISASVCASELHPTIDLIRNDQNYTTISNDIITITGNHQTIDDDNNIITNNNDAANRTKETKPNNNEIEGKTNKYWHA